MMTNVRSSFDRPPGVTGDVETVPARARVLGTLPDDLTLLVVSGPDRGRALRLSPGRHVVGKASDCAVPLTDPQVSRHHLEIEVTTDQVRLRDQIGRASCRERV